MQSVSLDDENLQLAYDMSTVTTENEIYDFAADNHGTIYPAEGLERLMDENGVDTPIGGTLWNPVAIHYVDRTYIVWNAAKGGDPPSTQDPYITYFNHTSQSWGPKVKIDDGPLTDDSHGRPALIINSTGYIYVFYGGHGDPARPEKWAVSDNAKDISSWTLKGNFATDYTYPNLIADGTDMYNFYRRTAVPGSQQVLSYKKSTDDGETWGAAVDVVDFGTGYSTYPYNMEIWADQIHMAWATHIYASNDRRNAYHAYLNTTDGNMYAMDGTNFGAVVDKTEADANAMVADSGSLRTNWGALHIGSDGSPYLIYPFEKETTDNWTFEFAKFLSDGISDTYPTGDPDVPSTNLELAFDMETLDAGDMRDFSGNDYDGVITGATDIAGVIGRARDFEAADAEDLIQVADGFTNMISGETNFTVAFWFNPESLTSQVLWSRDGGNDVYGWVDSTGFVRFTVGTVLDTSGGLISAGTPYHFAFVKDGDTTAKIYINGTEQADGSVSATPTGTNEAFNIGRYGSAETPYWADGILDEAVVFSRALSPGEVANLSEVNIGWDNETITSTDDWFNSADFILHSSTSIEAYLTTAGSAGVGGDIERWSWNGSSWQQEEVILTEADSGRPLLHPHVVLDYDPDIKITYSQTTWGDFSTADVEVYVYPSIVISGPAVVPSRFDQARDLDGFDDYIDTGLDIPPDEFTLVAWVNGDDFSSSDSVSGILNKRDVAGNEWRLYVTPSGQVRFDGWANGGTTIVATSSVAISIGVESGIGLTWDGLTATFWIDGSEAGSTDRTAGPIQDLTDPITIGEDGLNDPDRFWDGLIDEVLIFSDVKTDLEMAELTTIRQQIVIGGGSSIIPTSVSGMLAALPYIVLIGLFGGLAFFIFNEFKKGWA